MLGIHLCLQSPPQMSTQLNIRECRTMLAPFYGLDTLLSAGDLNAALLTDVGTAVYATSAPHDICEGMMTRKLMPFPSSSPHGSALPRSTEHVSGQRRYLQIGRHHAHRSVWPGGCIDCGHSWIDHVCKKNNLHEINYNFLFTNDIYFRNFLLHLLSTTVIRFVTWRSLLKVYTA